LTKSFLNPAAYRQFPIFSQRGTEDALQAIGVIALAKNSPAHPKYHKQYQTKGD
jgi:hypothetical protein